MHVKRGFGVHSFYGRHVQNRLDFQVAKTTTQAWSLKKLADLSRGDGVQPFSLFNKEIREYLNFKMFTSTYSMQVNSAFYVC